MTDSKAIAIVGLSCSFPGSPDVEQFWRGSQEGRTFFRDVPADRWNHTAFYSPNPRHTDSTYARKIAHLADIRSFAPEQYGMPPRRARPMDPQQRLILDQTRLAMENGGYGARPLPRSTGVYIGASVTEYKDLVVSRLRARQILTGEWGDVTPFPAESIKGSVQDIAPIQQYSMVGLLLNMIACNVSEAFELEGPSLVLDAACSSALLAVHEAVLHLRSGISDAAVVGGVYTICTPDLLVGFSRIGALSRSDVCRPFDEKADGFVLGEGVGTVILKRFEDALRDGDNVLAVIRGVGLNNDGRSDGPMTPRLKGQAAALARAYRDADLSPDTVGYVEAHGTATPVGDRTEIGALIENARTNANGGIRCAVASVKGNIGHTLAAAGMAGLIRAVMALGRRTIPPQAGLHSPHADLGLDGSGFFIPTTAQPFESGRGLPRRAGVNAFGFGGTNVHIILEEPPQTVNRRVIAPNGHGGSVSPRQFWVVERKDRRNGFGDTSHTSGLTASTAPPSANAEASMLDQQRAAPQTEIEPFEREAKVSRSPTSDGNLSSSQSTAGDTAVEVQQDSSADAGANQPKSIAAETKLAGPTTRKEMSLDSIREMVIELVSQVTTYSTDRVKPEHRLGPDLRFDSLIGTDLFVALTETFPETRDLPQSLLGGDTTVEDLVQAVAAAVYHSDASSAVLNQEILRYTLLWEDRPLLVQPERIEFPFDGPVLLVPDSGGVAELFARRLREANRGVRCVSPAEPLVIDGEHALVDLSGLDEARDELVASEFRDPVLGALRRVAKLAANSTLQTFVVAHRGLSKSGLTGVAKSVAREYHQATVKSIEIEDDPAPASVAEKIFAELIASDQTVEVRYVAGGRQTVTLQQNSTELRPLREGVVVAIAGGGRGLGAKLAVDLARRFKARLLLLGRSPEAEATMRGVQEVGGNALYVCCDVRDLAQVERAFQLGREAFGPIEFVVHAAGVLADQSLASKDVNEAATVLDTKITGALALWQAARPDPLAAFLMYGSWAGRFGSAYQSDYSAANHVLGRLSAQLGGQRPGTRVVTLDLPPWEQSSMVSRLPEAASRALRSRVKFLTDSVGLDHVVAEMGVEGPSGEVVIGAGLEEAIRLDRLCFHMSTAQHPWLEDHQIDGQVLLPFAVALDQSAAAAQRLGLGPGLSLSNVEILEALTIEDSGSTFTIIARGGEAVADISVERFGNGTGRPSHRLKGVTAANTLPLLSPAGGKEPELLLADFYRSHTFHGPRLQALTKVEEVGPTHAIALARASDVDGPQGAALDTLLLDAMLQLCAYWATIHLGQIGLPVGADEVRVLGRPQPAAMVRIVGSLRNSSDQMFAADLDLLGVDGDPLIQIRGLRCRLMQSKALNRQDQSDQPLTFENTIDSASWRIEEFPEVKALGERFELARAIGMESPYFSVHERVTNDTSVINGREYVNFASYNYLGLSGDADVNAGALEAMNRYGTSVSASRLASGEKPLHRELESEIADFLGCEDAIVMVGGHATNVSVIGTLFGPQDLVVHDSLAHDSILAGIRLSGAKRLAFPHNDVEALDQILSQTRRDFRRVLIGVEGVYSMDGDIAPLEQIVEVKKRHKALLLVDEAHSLGVLGATGRGIGENCNIDRRDVELWMGTLSKSLASCGGYIAGSKALVQYLKYSNPGFVYSVGISPANAGAALAALRKLRARPDLVTTLQSRSRTFLDLSRQRGLNLGFSGGTAVVPCIVGNSWDCLRLSRALAERSINAQPILYPAVEEQLTRLRFFITTRHSENQIRTAVAAIAEELERINPKLLKPQSSH